MELSTHAFDQMVEMLRDLFKEHDRLKEEVANLRIALSEKSAQPLASQMRPQSAVQGWKDKLTNIRNILGGRAEQGDQTCLKALWAVDELIIALRAPQPPQGEGSP